MPGQGHRPGGQGLCHQCSPSALPAMCPSSEPQNPRCRFISGQHSPWCGDDMGTVPPYQCDSTSVCAFAGGWGAARPYAPAQECHELSLHAKLSPGSLLQGAGTYWPGSALCNSNAGCFPGRTNGPSTCPALQLVLRLLPSHVHLQQWHCGLSGQGADGHPRQPARDHDRDVSMAPHRQHGALGGSRHWEHRSKPHSSATP